MYIYLKDGTTDAQTVERDHYHVMISYQWEAREVTLKVRNFLERNKVACWVDTDHVTEWSYKAAEKAIENSDVFLLFYSFKYFTSKNCRQGTIYLTCKAKIILVHIVCNVL